MIDRINVRLDQGKPSEILTVDDLEALLGEYSVEVLPMTHHHGRLALDAFARYGKGSGSKAQLNFGDCIAYGLAKSRNAALLFKRDDLVHTDVVPALT